MSKIFYGVGINDTGVAVKKCPIKTIWYDMLVRVYSAQSLRKFPSYIGCSVSEEWLTFSNFKEWVICSDWKGLTIDKDILSEGNKVYSSETCCWVSRPLNNFVIDNNSKRGNLPLGVTKRVELTKYRAGIHNPFTGRSEYIGYYVTADEAHLAWKRRKHEFSLIYARRDASMLGKQGGIVHFRDERVAEALKARYL